MKRIVFFALIIISFTLWIVALGKGDDRGIKLVKDLSHQSDKLGAYHALLIGIDDYKDPKIPDLKTAVADAEAVAKILKECYGFSDIAVIKNRRATKSAIDRAIRKKIKILGPDDSLLIYYAGHGELDRLTKDGWWVPADAKAGDNTTYFQNITVQSYLRAMKARHVFLVSDSCYSGTLFRESRGLPPLINDQFYLDLYNERSRWGMTSGNKTPVSDQGFRGHSVFAYQFIRKLEKNRKLYLTPREIYADIGPIVRNNSEQMPLCRPIKMTGDQGGEFVFVASRSTMLVRPSKKPPVPSVPEEEEKRMAEERARLEAERKRLAREKAQLEADRKRLEAERGRPEQAKAVREEEVKRKEEKKGVQKGEESSISVQLKPDKEKEQMASLPGSVRLKPYERQEKSRLQFESKPGLYANQNLGFSVTYPKSWIIDSPRFQNEVYTANGTSGPQSRFPNVRVFIAEKPKSVSLEDYPGVHLEELNQQFGGGNYTQIEKKKILTLEDGTPAVECEVKWYGTDGQSKYLVSYLAVYRDDKCISITSTDVMPLLFKKSVVERLKAVTNSLKFY